MFQSSDRVEAISKGRNYIGRSAYIAHLGKHEEFLERIAGLPCAQKHLEKEKQKLYNYLQNNETRINYGLFKENGLLFGSGTIESANRDIIQKRMKLSGQRWTLAGAQQMLNLRVCYKSGQSRKLYELITHYQYVA